MKNRVQRDWTHRGKVVVDRGVECQDGSKIFPFFPFLLAIQASYFTSSKTEDDFILKKTAFSNFRGEPCLSTRSNVETRHKVVKVISKCALLKRKLKKSLSDMCSMRRREVCKSLTQSLKFHGLRSRWLGKTAEETETIEHEFDVMKEKAFQDSRIRNFC